MTLLAKIKANINGSLRTYRDVDCYEFRGGTFHLISGLKIEIRDERRAGSGKIIQTEVKAAGGAAKKSKVSASSASTSSHAGTSAVAMYGTTMALEDFYEIVELIEDRLVPGDYRNVMDVVLWQNLYQARDGYIQFCKGVEWKSFSTKVIPCHECGIVFPLHAVTVDHHEPQSTGGKFAVIKVLRSIDKKLTESPMHGARDKDTGVVPTLLTKATPSEHSAKKRMETKSRDTAELKKRFTLTHNGIIAYSLLRKCFEKIGEDFENKCMNSYANLTPMCARCNYSKNDKSPKYISFK